MTPAKPIETLEVRNRAAWRKWLQEHFDSTSEIWLVFHKPPHGHTVHRLQRCGRGGAVLRMDRQPS